MTLNDVEGHSPIASFLSNVFRTVVQSLTRTQLTPVLFCDGTSRYGVPENLTTV